MKWLISFGILIVLLIGGLIAAPNFVDWNKYKTEASAQVAKHTGLKLDIKGDVSLALLPSPRIYLEDVSLADPSDNQEILASFKMLDVRVALGALMSGKFDVSSVHLDQPQVRLIQDAQGRFNFMTPELESIMSSGEGAGGAVQGKAVAVSFDEVVINDGAFMYQSGGQKTQLEAVNLSLQASSLSGPFSAKGSLSVNGQSIGIDAKTGNMDMKAQSGPVNANFTLDGIKASFSGAVNGGETPRAQGDFELTVDSLAKLTANQGLEGGLMLNGELDADTKAASVKDMKLTALGINMSGSAKAGLSPLSLDASMSASEPLNLDKFMGGSKSGSGSPLTISQALPKTLELPALGEVKLNLSFPGMLYNTQRFEGVSIAVSKQDKGFAVSFSANDMPGKGPLEVDAVLQFADKSVSQNTGTVLYSDPRVNVDVRGQSQNLPITVKGLTGMDGLPLVSTSKTGVFDVKAHVEPSGLYLDEAVVNIDKDAFSAKGSLASQGESLLPLLKASVIAERLDFDAMMMGSKKGGGSAGLGGEMPFDVELDATVHEAVLSSQTIKGLKVGVRMSDQKLIVNKVAADDFGGRKFDIDGVIAVDISGRKPAVNGKVQLGDLVWKSVTKQSQKVSGGERWPSSQIESAWLNSVDADVEVAANSINYEGWLMQKPSIAVKLNDGVLNISSLKAGLYGGSLNASGTLKAASGDKGMNINGQASIDKVNMEPLVTSLTAGSRLIQGKGIVSLETDIRGDGLSMKDLIGSLNGGGNLSGNDIVIEGVDVQRFVRALSDDAKPGDSALNLWKGVATQGSTSFETLDGSYTVQGGVINIEKLLLDGPRAAIDTTGQISLPAWTIKTAHEMSVKDRDDVPPFTVNISGSLDNPANTLAGGVLNDYLQRKIQRKLEKVIGDSKLGEKLDQKLGLDGVLKGVLGGAATQQQQPAPVNDNNAPSSEETEQPQSQKQEEPKPEAKDMTPEDAVNDLLNSFLR